MGNPTAITGATASAYTATYNLAGRLATLTKAGATTTYAYDNSGRRIRKFISSGTGAGAASTVIFAYDLNDQLIGEYTSTGAAIREYAWLGNIPIAIFTPDPAAATNPPLVYYIQTDHLNTPRVVFNKANQIRWRWLAEPFGTTAPETNPSGLGVFTQPLRFPGQVADAESGLFYNHWRTYDPATGRYTQSDPIGLAGGSFSTYDYVNGQPTRYTDPNGLQVIPMPPPPILLPPARGSDIPQPPSVGPSIGNPIDWMFKNRKPRWITGKQESYWDAAQCQEGDPCQQLKSYIKQEIRGARTKQGNMFADEKKLFSNAYSTPNPAVTGSPGTWVGHVDDLSGRIGRINNMIAMGQRMGCDMSEEISMLNGLYVPNAPRLP
jgi:RHS repeat-associated protein